MPPRHGVLCPPGRPRTPTSGALAPAPPDVAPQIAAIAAGEVIAFAGGEPTRWDDLPAWIQAAEARGPSRILVQTNGRRLAYRAFTRALRLASPRLAVSGTGRIELNDQMDAELSFRLTDTSLDPYLRQMQPAFSSYTSAVASGTIRVVGELYNPDALRIDRVRVVRSLRMVDDTLLAVEEGPGLDRSFDLLRAAYPDTELEFCNGGDRKDENSLPTEEAEAARRNDIRLVYGVGGFDKADSSTRINTELGHEGS